MTDRYIPDMEPIDILQPIEELAQKKIPLAHMFGMAAAEISYLRARIAELEAALRPFTDVESIVPFFHDAGWGLYAHVVTKRDMEAARAALGEKE
jgi:hypothetical protein